MIAVIVTTHGEISTDLEESVMRDLVNQFEVGKSRTLRVPLRGRPGRDDRISHITRTCIVRIDVNR